MYMIQKTTENEVTKILLKIVIKTKRYLRINLTKDL